MNFIKQFTYLMPLAVLLSLNASAHRHDHLSKEALIAMVIEQEAIIESDKRAQQRQKNIIAKQAECIKCLEHVLEKEAKHTLHKEHRYHSLVKALYVLLNF